MSEDADDKERRIVEARRKLMARWEQRMRDTPALSDTRPQGSGPPNRHGMPKLPVGQTVTRKWPVLDLGRKPVVPKDRWQLKIDGAVEQAITLDWAAFMALPQTEDTSDFHCVTSWSKMDMKWVGVRFSDLMALVHPTPAAVHVMCHGYDDYTTNVALEEALKPDVLLAHTVDGHDLPVEHGGPVRMITPQLYAWKGSKWICRIELLTREKLGFWEMNGYSSTAHPWRDDRYGRIRGL
ncbi:molybdopterin-dependent oxidoreductase [Nannocystis pusilla]|uniref:Molybdopterin-dependent oxidoreductase n=1 Tax=Nannocystis pusilla TaxID=889268 RepID=A0ABS7TS05_9BACT|nr:molybdopterin-dependent oxidoreductase [Nannocystis pusilla]MBZ5710998.1 molybdopterin-dependent oxidoreductase [Nannocystis pusilla]